MKNMKILLVAVTWILAANTGFAADKKPTGDETSKAPQKRVLKIDDNEVDLSRLEKEGAYRLNQVTRRQKLKNGKEIDVKFDRRAQYSSKSKRVAYIESAQYNDAVQGHLKVYDENGTKVFDKTLEPEKGAHRDFQDVRFIGSHYLAAFTRDIFTERRMRLDVYNTDDTTIMFSTSMLPTDGVFVPPSEDYMLLLFQDPKNYFGTVFKYDSRGLKKIAEGPRLYFSCFSNDGKYYVLTESSELEEKAPSGDRYKQSRLECYSSDKSVWSKTVKHEGLSNYFSINGRYLVLQFKQNRKYNERRIVTSWETTYSIIETATGESVVEGKLSAEQVERYKNEMVGDGVSK